MPTFYEDAAHILLFLTRAGLIISPQTDSRLVIMRLAQLLGLLSSEAKSLTHYGAAAWMMDNLRSSNLVLHDETSRARLLAILGTRIGDFKTMQDAERRRHSRAS